MSNDSTELLVAANDVVDRLGVLWGLFRSYKRIPVRVEVRLDPNLQRSGQMTVLMPDNQTATANVSFVDELQQPTAAPGPVVWSVSDDTIATITPSGDGSSATLQPLKLGTFTVAVSSGTLAGTSDNVEVDPTAATAATISVQVNQMANAEEARAVHGEAKTHTAGGGHHTSQHGA